MTKRDIRDCKTCLYGQKMNVTAEIGDVTELQDTGRFFYYDAVIEGYICSLGHNQNIKSKLDRIDYCDESDIEYPECTLYFPRKGLISTSAVVDLLKDLYAQIDNQPENKDGRYNGILDGVITAFIEELELRIHNWNRMEEENGE